MAYNLEECEYKLSRCKAQLVMEHPFFAALACNRPVEITENLPLPTAATDGRSIKFHPQFVQDHSVAELKAVMCHEVGHMMFLHMFRRGHRDPMLWNIAGDVIINHLLIEEGLNTLPKGAVIMPDIYEKGGGTTDGVYDVLRDMAENSSGRGKGSGIPDQFDTCEDSGGSDSENDTAQANMKVEIQQATQIAKMRGQLGSALERFVNAALKPVVDWRTVLRRFVSQRAKVERTYARPRRRFLAEGLYLPSMGGERMGDILIAVDCSGSVSDEELGSFAAEMLAIKQDVSPYRIHVLYFHHEVSKYDVFERDDELTIKPNGTGGTAFSPIFAYAAAKDIQPECCVVLTDLCCNDFGPAPDYPVLWVSNHSDQAPWGQIVLMKDNR